MTPVAIGHPWARAGNEHGVYTAQANDAWILFSARRYGDFLHQITPALDFYRRTGARRNAAITLRGVGLAEAATGQATEAVAHLREALGVFTELDLRLDTAMALNGLGDAHLEAGEPDAAWQAYGRAVEAARLCGSPFEEARAHYGLGLIAFDRDDRATAQEHLRTALAGYEELNAPQAAAVHRALTRL